MTAIPPRGSFLPRAGTNGSRGSLFEEWLNQSYSVLGFAAAEGRAIVGGVLSPQRPRVVVDTEGATSADDLTSITAGTFFSTGAIICLSSAAQARKTTVRSGIGNIVLKTSTFVLSGPFCKLWLEYNGSNWGEINRDYGQDWAQFRSHHQIDGATPIAGQPATYRHANGADAQAGTDQAATMTPAATAVALQTAALVITNRTVASALAAGDKFLLARAGVLYQIDIGKLLAPSFVAYVEIPEVTLGQANAVINAHSLGVRPKLTRGFLRCKTTELGHNAGEELPVEMLVNDGTSRTVNFGADGANYWVRMSNVAGVPKLPGRGNGNLAGITIANWRFFMRMWA